VLRLFFLRYPNRIQLFYEQGRPPGAGDSSVYSKPLVNRFTRSLQETSSSMAAKQADFTLVGNMVRPGRIIDPFREKNKWEKKIIY
jgi:hypothetical protein